jgi:hypothetical protein
MKKNIDLEKEQKRVKKTKKVVGSRLDSTLGTILTFLILIAFAIIIYFIYLNFPTGSEKVELDVETLPELEIVEESEQFFPKMKFNHNSISYMLDSACSQEKRNRVIEAFDELSSLVSSISFYEVSTNPDIEVVCSEYSKKTPGDYFVAGEGGAKEIIQTGRYNIITEGVIILHGNPHGFYECEWANIELHELIHVFGFDHSSNENSLMYPYLSSCDQKLDSSIINMLKELYAEENLPDLYFQDFNVIKKGRYLDFNLTVKNSGSIDAKGVSFDVLDEGGLVKTFSLDDLKFGAGMKVEIQNLRLIHRNPDEIKFVIDRNNLIKEIDEENNIAKTIFEN